jgi:hypothetical protein
MHQLVTYCQTERKSTVNTFSLSITSFVFGQSNRAFIKWVVNCGRLLIKSKRTCIRQEVIRSWRGYSTKELKFGVINLRLLLFFGKISCEGCMIQVKHLVNELCLRRSFSCGDSNCDQTMWHTSQFWKQKSPLMLRSMRKIFRFNKKSTLVFKIYANMRPQ